MIFKLFHTQYCWFSEGRSGVSILAHYKHGPVASTASLLIMVISGWHQIRDLPNNCIE